MTQQRDQARAFQALHDAPELLVLGNVWDVGSAILFERAGFKALGTTSAGMSYSLGYPDGKLTFDDLLRTVQCILKRVNVPLSVDLERGYGQTPEGVVQNVGQVIALGAVGVNLEDGQPHSHSLADLDAQCEVVAAVSALKTEFNIPFVLNARTDAFWLNLGDQRANLASAIARAKAYVDAGADCVFVPGALNAQTIRTLVQEIPVPLNVIAHPESPSLQQLEHMGVARLSLGSVAVRAMLGMTRQLAHDIAQTQSLAPLFVGQSRYNLPSYSATNQLFEV
ncbi:MAG: isocitrate lyase/phosphoenolpyruvate mutase family protein [Deinococcota bacterium]